MTVKVRGQLAGAGFLLLPGFLGCNSDNLAWRPLGLVEHHLWFTASIASLLLSPSFSGYLSCLCQLCTPKCPCPSLPLCSVPSPLSSLNLTFVAIVRTNLSLASIHSCKLPGTAVAGRDLHFHRLLPPSLLGQQTEVTTGLSFMLLTWGIRRVTWRTRAG